MAVKSSPGLYFAVAERTPAPAPLRSDIAGFIGRTARGPVGTPIRVEGIRGFQTAFGGLNSDSAASYAVNSYFENGGETAWIVRVAGTTQTATGTIAGLFLLGLPSPQPNAIALQPGCRASTYRVDAASPGSWANGATVTIRFTQSSGANKPVVDISTRVPGLRSEYLTRLDPENLADQVASASALIRLTPLPGAVVPSAMKAPTRRSQVWEVRLDGGQDGQPTRDEYLAAAQALNDEPEPAIVSAPDLHSDFDALSGAREDILSALIQRSDELIDRLVLVDIPPENWKPADAIAWLDNLRGLNGASMRAAAAYHPRVLIPDPLGGVISPWRPAPASGSIAGVISRLDRERGAYYTPANAPIVDAADTERQFTPEEQALFHDHGINLMQCFRSRGLYVWGGRTCSTDPNRQFVAHRRLIHRLVRAIRRVAEPLVFDTNGPELWLTLVRATTTVLLAAYRAGALQGARPDEAFRVTCDATTNPPKQVDNGTLICLIEIAPAVPMEFILLRIALSGEGVLEVFEQ